MTDFEQEVENILDNLKKYAKSKNILIKTTNRTHSNKSKTLVMTFYNNDYYEMPENVFERADDE